MSLRERTRPGPAIIVARNLTSKPSISGAQLRAARALLKWSVRELSDQCHLSQSAIARSEQVNGTFPMRVQNLTAIRRVFEEHGIEFLGLDGVRLLPRLSENYAEEDLVSIRETRRSLRPGRRVSNKEVGE